MTQDEKMILEFEEKHPEAGVRKRNAIWRELDMTPARYEQRLLHLLQRQDVIAAFPMVANRRARLAVARKSARASRSFY